MSLIQLLEQFSEETEVRQVIPSHALLKQKDPQNLICPCSGVYRDEVEQVCQEGGQEVELMAQLGLGLNCGHCTEIILREGLLQKREVEETPPPWLEKAQKVLPIYYASQTGGGEVEVLGWKNGEIVLATPAPLDPAVTARLQKFIADSWGQQVEVRWDN